MSSSVGSSIQNPQQQNQSFQSQEEQWFVDERGRPAKRPFRSSPTTPPPPIGDALADQWFR